MPARPLLAIQSAYFQAAGLRVPCAPAHGRNVRRLYILQAAPARGPSTVAPGYSRPCGPPCRAFQLSGLKIGRLRNVLHTNSFFRNHRGRRVRFYAGAGVEPRPAVRCGLDRWRGAVEPRPPVWPAPVLRCAGIWGAGLRYRFAFARAVSERRQRFAFFGAVRIYCPPAPQKLQKNLGGRSSKIKRVPRLRMRLFSPPDKVQARFYPVRRS